MSRASQQARAALRSFSFLLLVFVFSPANAVKKTALKSKNYKGKHYSFNYPFNWRLRRKSAEHVEVVDLKSRSRGSVHIEIYASGNAIRLVDFVRAYNSNFRKQIKSGKLGKSVYKDTARKIPASSNAMGVVETYSYTTPKGKKTTFTREFQQIPGKQYTAYIITVARDSALKNNQAGFDLVYKSFSIK